MGFPGGSAVKNPSARQEIWVQILGGKEPLEKDLATHFGILAWAETPILWPPNVKS